MTERWRVGTLSLGLSFVTVGILILFAQFAGKDLSVIVQLWWPIIFVLLGLEILGYLFLSRNERPVIRYDFFGLFMVGMIGFFALILLVLASTGLMREIRQSLALVEVQREVSPLEREVPAGITRIVLQNPEGDPIRLEKGKTESLHIFGACAMRTLPDEANRAVRAEEIVSVRTIGDTMYVTVMGLPEKQGFVPQYARLHLTAVVPETVNVETEPPMDVQK